MLHGTMTVPCQPDVHGLKPVESRAEAVVWL
jgi:hypothetical protein